MNMSGSSLATLATNSSVLPPPQPQGIANVGVTSNQKASGGPLPGNHTMALQEAKCASSDIYSLTIQKGEDDNNVMTLIIEDYSKQVLDHGQTSAEFGIVSLSGTC